MSRLSRSWRPPSRTFAGVRRSHDGNLIALPAGVGSAEEGFAAPFLQSEVELWSKCRADVAFPAHPAFRTHLYDRAWFLLEEAGVLRRLERDQVEVLSEMCWRLSSQLFQPFRGVRASIDRLADEGGFSRKGLSKSQM